MQRSWERENTWDIPGWYDWSRERRWCRKGEGEGIDELGSYKWRQETTVVWTTVTEITLHTSYFFSTCLNSFNPHTIKGGWYFIISILYPSKAERGQEPCPRSHSWWVEEPRYRQGEGGETCSESGYILQVDWTELATGLDVGVRERGFREDSSSTTTQFLLLQILLWGDVPQGCTPTMLEMSVL